MENQFKKVKYNLPAQEMDMGGFPVKQAIPTRTVEQVDPFLLLHHAQVKFSNKKLAKHQGVGPHPHRGFSPVTFVIEGAVQHRDSRGNNAIARKGDVQWMHAGAGIVHSERPPQELIDSTRFQEIIQLWINTPANKKMDAPSYQLIQRKEMPFFKDDAGKVLNHLITGSYNDLNGPALSQSPNTIIWSEMQLKGHYQYELEASDNIALYLIKGGIKLGGYGLVEAENLIVFENEGQVIDITATAEDTQFLILAGKPIEEALTQYGPFVMNNQTQIMEAMRDYQMGKMGILIEED